MKMGKRQLVLAALVVALGAAVYLNFTLSGGTQLPATQAVASGRELGQTLLVNASGSAIVSSGGKAASGMTSGVVSASSGTSSGAVKTSAEAGTLTDEYFSQARLNRQKARDAATELLTEVLNDAQKSDAAKTEAVDKAAVIAQNIQKETNIENLIKAKGYPDCIVSIEDNGCNVIVKTKTAEQDDAIIINDIVSGQTGLSYDKIKIVERQ